MTDYNTAATFEYDNFMGFWTESPVGLTNPAIFTYPDTDMTFEHNEDVGSGNLYIGFMTLDVNVGGMTVQMDFPVVTGSTMGVSDPSNSIVIIPQGIDPTDVTFPDPVDTNGLMSPFFASAPGGVNSFTHCFAKGTEIATTDGPVAVEDLTREHNVITPDGSQVPVKWVGRQTLRRQFSPLSALNMVQISAGALGNGVPSRDLTVTGDHGMVLDGLVINASALVNGTTITQVPISDLPDRFVVYHVETEAHDVILAEGAASETFVDMSGRKNYDNFDEYMEIYGVERIIPEMDMPRIATSRLLPETLKTRLDVHTPEVSKAG